MIRKYSHLRRIESFEDRYKYLRLQGSVGTSTFGFDRHVNQAFYRSTEWRRLRNDIIVRDNGCDLGVDDYEIHGDILVHHMNPMTMDDITEGNDRIFDPEFLITTSHRTHNAIHFGDESQLPRKLVERRPGDTTLWTPIMEEV